MWPFGLSRVEIVLADQVEWLRKRLHEAEAKEGALRQELLALLTPDALARVERLRYGLREEMREERRAAAPATPEPEEPLQGDGIVIPPRPPDIPPGVHGAALAASGHTEPELSPLERQIEDDNRRAMLEVIAADESAERAVLAGGGA